MTKQITTTTIINMNDSNVYWYVLFVMGGKERVICEYLNRNESLHAFIIQKEVVHKREGKVFTVLKPMFPSYVFVETLLDHTDFQYLLIHLKKEKEGIIKELKYDDEITSLLPQERIYLENLLDPSKVVKASSGYMINDKVVITEGPLMGYESNIVKINRHQKKAELEIKILDNVMKATVSLEIVRKI